jgi:hypothetical protein
MDRAYSLITVKEMDDERRVIRGMATTPEVDRMGDIVDPFGVKVAEDIPLFLYHDSNQTVGRASFGKATKDGIPFTAVLPVVKEAGRLKDRVDEAWQMVKYRLITGVSIGFRAMEDGYERLKNGGLKFTATEVLELSLVPVPANAGATITGIKSLINDRQRAVSGQSLSASPPPGVPGIKQPASGGFSFSRNQKGSSMKTINEQINDLRETRAQAEARMKEIGELVQAGDESVDMDEFNQLEAHVKDLDRQILVKRVESMNASSARPVDGLSSKGATGSRGPTIIVKSADPEDKFPGQSFVRKVKAQWMAQKNQCSVGEVADYMWGKTHPGLVRWIKASVAGGGTGSGEWGAELAESDSRYTGDFLTFLYGATVFDRLPLRAIPHNVQVKGQDGAATGYWVGQSKAIPVSAQDYSDVELTALDVGALCVVSNRLMRDASPAGEMLFRDALVEASAQRVDTTFLGAAAASAGVSPAGLLNGVTAVQASGTDAAAIRADIQSLYAPFFAAKNASGVELIMTPSMAKAISLLVNSLGQTEFPGLTASGGTLLGDRVWTGDNVTAGNIIAIKPSDVWKIGDTGVQVSLSREATIEMNDAPAGASDTPVAMASHAVSMFQTESTAIKVVRQINYAKRRSHAVQFIENAEYGGVVS